MMAISDNKQPFGAFNQLLQVFHDTAPRSIEATRKLATLGMGLLAIKITRLSTVVGYQVDKIPLPDYARIICVGRDDESFFPTDAGYLQVGDTVFVLYEQGQEAEMREIFTSPAPVCPIPRGKTVPWPGREFYVRGSHLAD